MGNKCSRQATDWTQNLYWKMRGRRLVGRGRGGKIFHLALDSTSNGRQKDAIQNHYCSVFGALLSWSVLPPFSFFPIHTPLPTSACNLVHMAAIFSSRSPGAVSWRKLAWFGVHVPARRVLMCLHGDPDILTNSFQLSDRGLPMIKLNTLRRCWTASTSKGKCSFLGMWAGGEWMPQEKKPRGRFIPQTFIRHWWRVHCYAQHWETIGENKSATALSLSVDISVEGRLNLGPTPTQWPVLPGTVTTWGDSELGKKLCDGLLMSAADTVWKNGSTLHVWQSLSSAAL